MLDYETIAQMIKDFEARITSYSKRGQFFTNSIYFDSMGSLASSLVEFEKQLEPLIEELGEMTNSDECFDLYTEGCSLEFALSSFTSRFTQEFLEFDSIAYEVMWQMESTASGKYLISDLLNDYCSLEEAIEKTREAVNELNSDFGISNEMTSKALEDLAVLELKLVIS